MGLGIAAQSSRLLLVVGSFSSCRELADLLRCHQMAIKVTSCVIYHHRIHFIIETIKFKRWQMLLVLLHTSIVVMMVMVMIQLTFLCHKAIPDHVIVIDLKFRESHIIAIALLG